METWHISIERTVTKTRRASTTSLVVVLPSIPSSLTRATSSSLMKKHRRPQVVALRLLHRALSRGLGRLKHILKSDTAHGISDTSDIVH